MITRENWTKRHQCSAEKLGATPAALVSGGSKLLPLQRKDAQLKLRQPSQGPSLHQLTCAKHAYFPKIAPEGQF